MLESAKYRAKKAGLEFDLRLEDVPMPEVCPILGLVLDYTVGTKGRQRRNSPSLDRIKPNEGYVLGNVQVISYMANSMKQEATPEQLKLFSEWVVRTFTN